MVIVYLTSPKTKARESPIGNRISVRICVVLAKHISTEVDRRKVMWRARIGAEVVIEFVGVGGTLNGAAIMVGSEDE